MGKIFKAKVTICNDGQMVVEPYQETGSSRYRYMLNVEHAHLKRTLKDYIVVFRFPRAKGILSAARHLIIATSRLVILMCNEYFNHYVK